MIFSDTVIQHALFHWDLPRETFRADKRLETNKPVTLRNAREASLRSVAFMAAKLQMSSQAYCKLEANEMSGAITLASLRKAAEVLGCEVVCSVRPKPCESQNHGARFQDPIWQACLEYAEKYPAQLRNPHESWRGRALGALVSDALKSVRCRRANGWMREAFTPVEFSERIDNARSAVKRLDRLRRSRDR